MSDPVKKKSCKNNEAESLPTQKQQTVVKGLISRSTFYIAEFVTNVKGLLSERKVSSDDLKKLICETERKIKEVFDKILKEVKVFEKDELQAYQHYSREELAKAELIFKEYSSKMKDISGELVKYLHDLKNGLKTKVMTYKEVQCFMIYVGEKIEQTKRLSQDMIKSIHETITDPELKRKFVTMVENNYKKFKHSMDALYTDIKETSAVEENRCRKSEATNGKSLKSISMSYIVRIMNYARSFLSGRSSQTEDMKNLLNVTEIKIKELYDGILKKVKDLHENELQNYRNYSKDELVKVKCNLQEYSSKVWKLSEDILKRLKILKDQLQTRVLTHEDFQRLVSYCESKIIETKKLTEDTIKNIQTTIKEPTFVKKLETMVETSTQKVKIAMDDLYTAIKTNLAKAGQLKSLPDKKSLIAKMPTFGKLKTSMDCSSAPPFPSNDNEAAASNCKGNAAIGLNKEKIPFFNLSKHFNSKTIYGRANVAKATYAGVLIYYIYRKVKE